MDEILIKLYFSPLGLQDSGNGHEGRGFTGSVGPYQGDYLPLVYLKGYPFEGLYLAVIGMDPGKFKHL